MLKYLFAIDILSLLKESHKINRVHVRLFAWIYYSSAGLIVYNFPYILHCCRSYNSYNMYNVVWYHFLNPRNYTKLFYKEITLSK